MCKAQARHGGSRWHDGYSPSEVVIKAEWGQSGTCVRECWLGRANQKHKQRQLRGLHYGPFVGSLCVSGLCLLRMSECICVVERLDCAPVPKLPSNFRIWAMTVYAGGLKLKV